MKECKQRGCKDCCCGSISYSSQREKATVPQESLKNGTEHTVPFSELKETLQEESALIGSPLYTGRAITCLRLTTYQSCIGQEWLGNSANPLSTWDSLTSSLILNVRTASPFSEFGAMVAALLLAFGMSILKISIAVPHSEKWHHAEVSQVLHSQHFR